MNTTEPPYFQVSCPCGEAGGGEVGMCLPGAVAGAYYFGVAGCFLGAVKSLWSGSVFGTTEVASGATSLCALSSQQLAERIIMPCVVDSIYSGGEWAITGIQEGAMACGIIGFCSNHYQSITGRDFPDIKMELSLIPNVQLVERT